MAFYHGTMLTHTNRESYMECRPHCPFLEPSFLLSKCSLSHFTFIFLKTGLSACEYLNGIRHLVGWTGDFVCLWIFLALLVGGITVLIKGLFVRPEIYTKALCTWDILNIMLRWHFSNCYLAKIILYLKSLFLLSFKLKFTI